MDLKSLLAAFHSDEDGASATEYIILLILIACVIILIVKAFGKTIQERYDAANEKVRNDVVFK
jgi:Flp pilus assembly pilin Flp